MFPSLQFRIQSNLLRRDATPRYIIQYPLLFNSWNAGWGKCNHVFLNGICVKVLAQQTRADFELGQSKPISAPITLTSSTRNRWKQKNNLVNIYREKYVLCYFSRNDVFIFKLSIPQNNISFHNRLFFFLDRKIVSDLNSRARHCIYVIP